MGCLGSKVSLQKAQNPFIKYIQMLQTLGQLLDEERAALAEGLVEMHFTQGEQIYEQGEVGRTLYILYEGEAVVIKDGIETDKLCASREIGSAHFFGEQALFADAIQSATVKVSSNAAKILALDRNTFNCMLGPFEELTSKKRNVRIADLRKRHKKIPLADVRHEKIPRDALTTQGRLLLCHGKSGFIDLVVHSTTGNKYALRGVSKAYIQNECRQKNIMNQRNISLKLDSPFIIKLYECYQEASTLYFLHEPALGGDLFRFYDDHSLYGSEKHAIYYSASVASAFEHMHERRIAYRNLKPENLLLDEHGHVKLSDMSIAKFILGKAYTMCGSSPDYYAPEVVIRNGYTLAVDWWSFGVLLHEFMSGKTPFKADDELDIFFKIKNFKGFGKTSFPSQCQSPVGELIKAVLIAAPEERLPMRPGGIRKLVNHDWYTSSAFDWVSLKEGTLDPPQQPRTMKCMTRDKKVRMDDFKDDGSDWDKGFAT